MVYTTSHRKQFLRSPSTAQGRRALMFWGIAVGGLVLGIGLAGLWFGLLEPSGGDQESPPIWFLLPMLAGALTALGTTIAGGIYAARAMYCGDRSVFLVLPALAVLIAITFFVGEFAAAH